MEKAIEIKRRAQRCIQNGDVDGALAEYEKLVAVEDSDPYNFVLLADLHFKKGDMDNAVQRYLAAVGAYEKSGLYKNAIAVCKKMMRLKLAPAKVLERLAALHALDGLGTEAALYYMQYAESLVRENKPADAADALRKAFEASPEEVKALERLSEAYTLAEKPEDAARAMAEAVYAYANVGQFDHAKRCRARAEQLRPGIMATFESERGAIPGMPSASPPDTVPAAPASLPSSLASGPSAAAAPADESPADVEIEAEMVADSEIETFSGPPALPSTSGSLALDDEIETFAGRAGAGIPPLQAPVDDHDREEIPVDDEATAAEAPPAATEIPSYAPLDEPEAAVEPQRVDGLEIASPRSPAAVAESAQETPAVSSEPEPRQELEPEPVAAPAAAAPAADVRPTVAGIEGLLARAQEHFKSGEREQAGELLVEAALAYERIDRLDNAASIFRSLARGAHASPRMLEHWLDNCMRRGDAREAAEVACELGDRAVSVGQIDDARRWFDKACEYDPGNAVAQRRLQRLGQVAPAAALPKPVAPVAEPEPEAAEHESGRVEMAVGRAEAVTFDLGSLLVEFQRGIEAQLSGDAQSHYDLAMTYWEMGLIEQAMDSFRLAAADPAFSSRAAEMIGRCMLDQGRYDEATSEFQIALQSPDLPAEAAIGLRYHLGLALEAAGSLKQAVAEYERVFAQQANYSDVALKLRVLRKALEAA